MKTQEEIRSDLDELFGKKKLIEDFLAHDGWKMIDEFYVGRMRAFRQNFLATPIDSLDAAFKAAGTQATVAEMQLAHSMPKMALEELDGEIETLKLQIAEMENDGRTDED